MLIYLIVDYTRNAELRERFRSNPELVLDWYEVSQEDRDALRAQGLDEWVRRAHEELDKLLAQETQGGSDPHSGSYNFFWAWAPIPSDFRFIPQECRVGDTLKVKLMAAESGLFQKGAEVEFRARGESVKAIKATVRAQGRSLEATVKFDQPGTYFIRVKQPDGPPLSSGLPFTVTRR